MLPFQTIITHSRYHFKLYLFNTSGYCHTFTASSSGINHAQYLLNIKFNHNCSILPPTFTAVVHHSIFYKNLTFTQIIHYNIHYCGSKVEHKQSLHNHKKPHMHVTILYLHNPATDPVINQLPVTVTTIAMMMTTIQATA